MKNIRLVVSKRSLNPVVLRVACSLLAGVISIAGTLLAQADLTWDVDVASVGVQTDGGGNWNISGTGNNHWWNGSANVFWSQGESAIFGVGTGAAGAITPGIALTVANLTFNAPGSGSYNIKPSSSGNKMTISGLITVVNGVTASIEMSMAGTGFTKAGAGTLTLKGTSTGHVNTYAGAVTVNEGILEFTKTSGTDGAITGDLLVATNATAKLLANNQIANTSTVTLNGGTLDVNGKTDTIGALAGNGPVLLGVGTLTVGGGAYSGEVSGTGGLTKNGAGTLTLSGVNSYSGTTLVSAGTLTLGSSLSNSAVINVAAGATLDASATGLTLATGQNLRGNGTLTGAATIGDGASLAPGNNAVGALTFSSTLALQANSTTTMELNKTTGSNDVALAATSIAYGGTLNVVNVGGDQTGAEVYQLFNAPIRTGDFTTVNLPVLPPGLSWTNTLTSNGSIAVVGSVAPPVPSGLTITNSVLVGTEFILSGSGGTNDGPYTVLTATNLAETLPNWTQSSAGNFDAGGNFTSTNTVDPAAAQNFFIIRQP